MDQENPEPDLVQISINDQLFWEILKLAIRGKTNSYASYKKRSQNRREIQIEEQLKYLSQNFDINKSAIDQLSSELVRIREDRVKGILLTAKVRWKVEDEKRTRYFCVEKRHFSENNNFNHNFVENKEVTDQPTIIAEQENFYKHLYATIHTSINAENRRMFFDRDNPFSKLSDRNKAHNLEGILTVLEGLKSLKNMKNNKSPGLDGFTVEFYNFFGMTLEYFW